MTLNGDWSEDLPSIVNVWAMPDAGVALKDGEHICDEEPSVLTEDDTSPRSG